jgi:hypothetical protein
LSGASTELHGRLSDENLQRSGEVRLIEISGFVDGVEDGRALAQQVRCVSGALDLANGSTNRFIIVAQDNQFTVYINRTREGRFFDNSKQRSDGALGFFGAQESGKGTCEFENAWVWSLDQ